MDWRALLRDRRLLWGVGAAAVVGLVVLLRKGGGGGGLLAGGADDEAGGIGYPGSVNTGGTDLAAALSNYSMDLQGQLAEFGRTIEEALGDIPTAPVTPTPPTPAKPPTTKPSTPKPVAKPFTVPVVKFIKGNPAWNSTLSGIANRYNTTVKQLMKLNPWIKNPNLIHPGQKVRVR